MKIASIKTNYIPAFSAKNENIRKADDIQRRARLTFPLLSPSYMDTFYSVTRLDSKDNPVNLKARKLFKKLDLKLSAIRDFSKNPEKYGFGRGNFPESPLSLRLNGMEFLKAGNCEECAIAALAALTANGYYDSQRVVLALETAFQDKETGNIVYEAINSLDHTFVVTTMGKKHPKEKDKIVVDPWLGFADSVSGAKARFKQIYNDDDYDKIKSYTRSMFNFEMAKLGKMINLDDYKMLTRLIFYPVNEYSEDDMKNIGFYSRIMYSNLILPKNDNDK